LALEKHSLKEHFRQVAGLDRSGIPALGPGSLPGGFPGAEARLEENGLTFHGMRKEDLDSLHLVIRSRAVVFWKTSDSPYLT